jgi:hypothetical protein
MEYVAAKAAGLLSSKRPTAVQGNDTHWAMPAGFRFTFLCERIAAGIGKAQSIEADSNGRNVPLPIVMEPISDVGE